MTAAATLSLPDLSSCPHMAVSAHGIVGWSAVCECGISWLYSLTF